ncbi:MAG: CoF synthetase [Muricauda sp.]|nr:MULTISPECIES: CoF synthetase [unclassified Allomuricauda]MAU15653.1 CoF synthetase [Allomuricauda sp.]|tara:strand:- start:449 stop:1837 length:1389 start_codon:yes stop_codon:yes gene_type:complete
MNTILEQCRNTAFWFLDTIKGGNIKKHYKEIQWVLENPQSQRTQEIKEQNLHNLLKHATTTVPFYKDVPENSVVLQDFPIIDKQTVRKNFANFRSRTYLKGYNHEVTTSGSTGKPFKILHNKDKRERNIADTCFFAGRAGFSMGSKLFYLRLWDKQYKKNKLVTQVQNIAAYSVDDLTEANLAKLVAEMERGRSNKNILAYASALDTVSKYVEEQLGRPLNCKFNSIISIAEALNPDVKKRVQTYLGTEVVSRYSNSENGILAQQRVNDASGKFEINWASYHIEMLDLNEDRPVKPGEVGRIVITDFFNYSMPIIRYDTGDVGIMEFDKESQAMVFSKIDGRKMDMFTNTSGEYISSHIIHHILQFNGIEQFQFIEEENGEYTIKLKVSEKFDQNDEDRIRHQYLEYFGEDAIINIVYVDDIPLLPSGKRKLVINKAILTGGASKTRTDKTTDQFTKQGVDA